VLTTSRVLSVIPIIIIIIIIPIGIALGVLHQNPSLLVFSDDDDDTNRERTS